MPIGVRRQPVQVDGVRVVRQRREVEEVCRARGLDHHAPFSLEAYLGNRLGSNPLLKDQNPPLDNIPPPKLKPIPPRHNHNSPLPPPHNLAANPPPPIENKPLPPPLPEDHLAAGPEPTPVGDARGRSVGRVSAVGGEEGCWRREREVG
ncbi:hypothetical protein CDD80_963 [Ophiocordyceps camponoti-rufipedis]|uniref:Uncharacterized protein n=1 Tax=Ophiocordyceps camponoti-rufipedis TaxID=2004952 RepID=A0A2C5YGU0_9HYPO|nr:hypothetical protein CDD80_963 [Ophiocordyceps camponoti-rufipedis]